MQRNGMLLTYDTTDRISLRHCDEIERTGLVTAFFTEGIRIWRDAGAKGADNEPARKSVALLANEIGVRPNQMVFAVQKHTDAVRVIEHTHAGEGAMRAHTAGAHDGLVTNVPGVLLCTLAADCLPIYLLDPAHRAIGMVHSGWRGTAHLIGPHALEIMAAEYGTQARDVLVHFGPSICGACYEVGAELREKFAASFSEDEMALFFTPQSGVPGKGDDGARNGIACGDDCTNARTNARTSQDDDAQEAKFLLDNAAAARLSLLHAGILPEHLSTCGICTYECDNLASYRRMGAARNHMLSAIMLT